MPPKKKTGLWTQSAMLFMGLTILLSYFTYFHNYSYPPNLFWDENYHIASAQKYLNNIFYMEPHPPLGKLFIALGEHMFDDNVIDNQFIGTDYGKSLPDGFSFRGYRFFPALFGWLVAPVFFLILLLITRKPTLAGLLSFLYIFDNANIVHTRGAMLDSTLLLFIATAILSFLLLLEWKDFPQRFRAAALGFGVSFGLVMTTKLNGLILLLIVFSTLFVLWPDKKKIYTYLRFGVSGFTIAYLVVWQAHFSLGTTINPDLNMDGYYRSSETAKKYLDNGKSGSPLALPVMLNDAWKFATHYEAGVPRLDMCKIDENGSPSFLWPIGGRSINYRWESVREGVYRYLYLQSNPVIWIGSFFGVLIATSLLLASWLLPLKKNLKNRLLLTTFLWLYFSYMIVMSRIDRVMYTYHYFVPLFFAFIVVGLLVNELEMIGKWKITLERKTKGLLIFAAMIFLSYQAYRPLTYYKPFADNQVTIRSVIKLWDLRCVRCYRTNPIVRPREK